MSESQSRQSRTHRELVRQATRAAREGAERAAADPYRPAYHFVPPGGWINDPNGLIQWRGTYHLFYQHNPYAPTWGAMHWGHATSPDLVHWRHRPVALAPSEPCEGTAGPGGGCFSGSAVADGGGLALVYTGCSFEPTRQVQCLATSSDGIEFEKYDGNPIVADPSPEGRPEDFRDPKVWRHGGEYTMVVGSTRDDRGRILLYRSPDLRCWDFAGVPAESDGTLGRMWECPDLFRLGDRHLLIISPIGVERRKSVTLIGDFDRGAGKFDAERRMDTDYGPGFYAPQSFLDEWGRRIMFAWMTGGGQDCPTVAYGWNGMQTLPRLLRWLPDGSLSFSPVPELADLRGKHHRLEELDLAAGASRMLEEVSGDALELRAVYRTGGKPAGRFGLAVRCDEDGAEETLIVCDPDAGTVALDLERSGSPAEDRYTAPVGPLDGGELELRVFVDRSSVEVFVNEGRAVLSARIFPAPESRGVRLFADGADVRLKSLEAWEMAPIWDRPPRVRRRAD